MRMKLNNPTVESWLIPKYPVGCRRFTPGMNYLETLGSPKVNIVHGNIKRFTKDGCIGDDDQEYSFDVLVCATGFDTSFRPRFKVVNGKGENLSEEWLLEPKSYLGLAVPNFPNYFTFVGPNSPIGNGPVLIGIGEQFLPS